ncbi:BglG family transcription antiterminator [Oceanobacillus caeni]|uniref:Ascorbate-specific PTS system EIIA component n=1 Tax=Oceanobacillus caeni TaxID=405946 RepID=A0ABR5MGA9_9BACI|nr:BglG family transcription antiterminator [Oceanobacillus caeni]KPH71484.1 transcription antiterminator BglG [Oceanobacillus caeni]MBU8790537.1 BglG family transcription antiterminator [Oceanobacillus caeni]
MIDQRSYILLKEITFNNQISKSEVMRKLSITERQLHYDLDKVNAVLRNLELPEIIIENNVFLVPKELKDITNFNLLTNVSSNMFIISEQDRIFAIYLYTFIRKEIISNYHYQLLLRVSKNTALSDVKKIKELCKQWNLEWVYSRVDGYHVVGSELDKRRLAAYCSDTLITQPLGKEIIILILKSWGYENEIIHTKRVVDDLLKQFNISLVKSRKSEMIIRLAFLRVRTSKGDLDFKEHEKKIIERQKIFKAGTALTFQLFPKGTPNESYYLTLQLLVSLQEIDTAENPTLYQLAERIITEFEKVTLLPIKNKSFLRKSLYNHLVPAFFRISFGIPLANPLKDRIKEEYKDLFEFVRQALAPLTMWTGRTISDEEIGYFTLHFGGHLTEDKKKVTEKLRALIICSNGISSSMMLKAQLSQMFSDIEFSSIHSLNKLAEISPDSYDMIFSTVESAAPGKPFYVVKPLLTEVEKNYLIQQVATDFPRMNVKNISMDRLMEVIAKYADIHDEDKLFSELVNLLYFRNTERGRFSPMLSELLTEPMIQFTDADLNWRDAISEVSSPLLAKGKIEQSYIEAMIKNVEEVGTYIHIGKGIAIPHARPEAGVNQVGMSFLRTKKPVLLLDKEEHAIDIFICIAAIDNEAHLRALSSLTKILADDSKLNLLKEANSSAEVINIIKKGEEE